MRRNKEGRAGMAAAELQRARQARVGMLRPVPRRLMVRPVTPVVNGSRSFCGGSGVGQAYGWNWEAWCVRDAVPQAWSLGLAPSLPPECGPPALGGWATPGTTPHEGLERGAASRAGPPLLSRPTPPSTSTLGDCFMAGWSKGHRDALTGKGGLRWLRMWSSQLPSCGHGVGVGAAAEEPSPSAPPPEDSGKEPTV